jgi:hypothetical protein
VRGGTHFSQQAGVVTEVPPNRGRNRSIVPVKYLDPTLDIVFKLLLLSTPELLRDNSRISAWRPLIDGLNLNGGPASSRPKPQRNSKRSPERTP